MTRLSFDKVRRLTPGRVRLAHAESVLLVIGIALLGLYIGARLHSFLFSRVALWRFNVATVSAATSGGRNSSKETTDISLWGRARLKAYRASLVLKTESPIGILSIHRLHMTVPVFDGTDELILNRGVGRISGTGSPGGDGNFAIAGHRDGFFRALKNIELGDFVEIETLTEKDTYIVDATRVVDPTEISVLQPSPVAMITLVTCYPFYFIGDAPERFIVKATLTRRELSQTARVVRQEQK
jgi:sortase A